MLDCESSRLGCLLNHCGEVLVLQTSSRTPSTHTCVGKYAFCSRWISRALRVPTLGCREVLSFGISDLLSRPIVQESFHRTSECCLSTYLGREVLFEVYIGDLLSTHPCVGKYISPLENQEILEYPLMFLEDCLDACIHLAHSFPTCVKLERVKTLICLQSAWTHKAKCNNNIHKQEFGNRSLGQELLVLCYDWWCVSWMCLIE